MDKSHTDTLSPSDATGALVAAATFSADEMKAEGIFTAVCTGPRDCDRAHYLLLTQQIAAIEASNFIKRITTKGLHQQLKHELAQIPLEEKWVDVFPNTVTTVGKNLAFNTFLAGSAYTVTGPYMGLIGATPTTVIGDTMTSHAGWTEVGGVNAPQYTAPRKTVAWNAASGGSISNSTALTFSIITTAGTVGGAFICYGSGAVSTIDNTGGTLWSAGAFTGGNRAVNPGDTLTVSYSVSM